MHSTQWNLQADGIVVAQQAADAGLPYLLATKAIRCLSILKVNNCVPRLPNTHATTWIVVL